MSHDPSEIFLIYWFDILIWKSCAAQCLCGNISTDCFWINKKFHNSIYLYFNFTIDQFICWITCQFLSNVFDSSVYKCTCVGFTYINHNYNWTFILDCTWHILRGLHSHYNRRKAEDEIPYWYDLCWLIILFVICEHCLFRGIFWLLYCDSGAQHWHECHNPGWEREEDDCGCCKRHLGDLLLTPLPSICKEPLSDNAYWLKPTCM